MCFWVWDSCGKVRGRALSRRRLCARQIARGHIQREDWLASIQDFFMPITWIVFEAAFSVTVIALFRQHMVEQ